MAGALDVALGVFLTGVLALIGYAWRDLVHRLDQLADTISGISDRLANDARDYERRLTRVESILDLRDLLGGNTERRQHPRIPD